MRSTLARTAIVVGLFAVGAAGAWLYVRPGRPAAPPTPDATAAPAPQPARHGRSVVIPESPTLCAEHGIPDVVCPFCDPSLVETLGHCGAHDVPEALCTRCNPVLITAFKAEGDWCAEHGLPESQCLVCRGRSES